MYNPFTLKDKTIFVTGASSGIGKAIAIECSKMGAKVIISGRNEQRLKETFSNLEGDNHEYITADLSNKDDLITLNKSLPVLDGLVNCAGLTKVAPFAFATRESFEEVMNVNFFAPTELTRLIRFLKRDLLFLFLLFQVYIVLQWHLQYTPLQKVR